MKRSTFATEKAKRAQNLPTNEDSHTKKKSMAKKFFIVLLCLSTVSFAVTPIRHHRTTLPQPDACVLEVDAQAQLAEVLKVACPLTLTGSTMNTVSTLTSAIAADLITAAKKHIGARYRRGSSGPSAFDCSGFTSYVFSKLGIKLKRSSREQSTQGTVINDIQQLLPGDLVFFGRQGKRGATVNHVGIVTSVDADSGAFEFIHSSTSQGVRVDRYPDVAYWERSFINGRRIIGTEIEE